MKKLRYMLAAAAAAAVSAAVMLTVSAEETVQTDIVQTETQTAQVTAETETSGTQTVETETTAETQAQTTQTQLTEERPLGWVTDENGNTYCYSIDGMLTGFQRVDGKEYYFAQNGIMKSGWYDVEGVRMYFSPYDGSRQLGFIDSDGYRYYADENGKAVGMREIDGKIYIFDDKGVMAEGWTEYGGSKYFGSRGGLYTGIRYIGGDPYCFSSKGRFKSGWQDVDGRRYFYDYETHSRIYGFVKYNSYIYYSDTDNGKYVGTSDIDGSKYRFSEKGCLETGFQKFSDGTRYFYDDGTSASGFSEIDGKTYYFGSDNIMRTGFCVINGKRYYFGKNGTFAPGITEVDGKYYYLSKKGELLYGWQEIDGGRYYFDSHSGAAAVGFVSIDGVDRYFGKNGVMYTDTKVDGYRIDAGGKAVKIQYELADEVLDKCGRTLRQAFDWCVDTLSYYSHKTHSDMYASDSVSMNWYADFGFKNLKGNCYVFAAVFCELARELGYEAYQISGTVPLTAGGLGPHSWTEVVMDGETFVFDTEACWEYAKDGGSYNGYKFRYGDKGTWVYNYGKRMDDQG